MNSILNPILVMCLGLGYLFNLYRGMPLVQEGGVMIVSHPRRGSSIRSTTRATSSSSNRSSPRRPTRCEIEAKFEQRFAEDPWYRHLYRTSYAYHGVHPFYMWYWGEHGRSTSAA